MFLILVADDRPRSLFCPALDRRLISPDGLLVERVSDETVVVLDMVSKGDGGSDRGVIFSGSGSLYALRGSGDES